ncbi:MAG: hypothetical protein JST80_02175 [Bdellovibrionales bacterium]|nr:hypothetical protein [Bdellovibrionales bacterium]
MWKLSALLLLPVLSHAECIVVDAYAVLRQDPDGKILRSIPEYSTLNVLKRKDGWIEVQSFQDKNRIIRCANEEIGTKSEVSGWIKESMQKKMDFTESMKVDPLGMLMGHARLMENLGSHLGATLTKDASCGTYRFSQTDRSWKDGAMKLFSKGAEVPGICASDDDAVACTQPDKDGEHATVCRKDDVETSKISSFGKSDRLKKISDLSKMLKPELEKVLGPEIIDAMTGAYPDWTALVVPHPLRDLDYLFDLDLIPWEMERGFAFGTEKYKKRKVWLFFATPKDALAQVPTLGFEGDSKIEFRRIPFALKDDDKKSRTDNRPVLCLAEGESFLALNACRPQSGLSYWIGSLDFRSSPPRAVDEDVMKRAVNALDKTTSCCEWNDEHYVPFKKP